MVAEQESGALERFIIGTKRRATSALAAVEVVRAVRPQGPVAIARARLILRQFERIPLHDEILEAAADLDPVLLRSLDAIHLATALALGADVDVVVTYDHRMQDAARLLGLRVAAPA